MQINYHVPVCEIEIEGELLQLGIDKYAYLPAHKLVIISDLHFGKITHFRKHGIALPVQSESEDLRRLQLILNSHDIVQCIFLGDLFHSDLNSSWIEFVQLINGAFSDIQFTLVVGNHDIMDDQVYTKVGINLAKKLMVGNILFSHEKWQEATTHYNIYGHIHPGVTLKGKGLQRLRLPCFYFGKVEGILPAFGTFTGLYMLVPKSTDTIFVAVKDKVIKITNNKALL